jgi:nucleotide-binding universal stress UspA family protein
MRNHGAALAAFAVALAGVGCGSSDQTVDQYFNALKARDEQTLSSFAAVRFEKPVDTWKITKIGEEQRTPVTAGEQAAKVKDLEAQVSKNTKDARATLDAGKVDEVKSLRRAGKPVPAALQAAAAEFDKFNQADVDLKRQLQAARDALEKERRNMTLSVGSVDNLEGVQGEVVTKQVELDLTLKDEQPAPYVMTLRRYELKREGPRAVSRWVVQDLKPRT